MAGRCIGVFSSIHFVLRAQKLLEKCGVKVETIPVPRQISSDCGVAISFKAADIAQVKDLLKGKNARLEGIYKPASNGTYKAVN